MVDDATVIAELGRKIVVLECQNNELEEKVKNLQELLDQALKVKKRENGDDNDDDEEEPVIEAVVRPWPISGNEIRELLPHTPAQSLHTFHLPGPLLFSSDIIYVAAMPSQAAASSSNMSALSAPVAYPALSAPSTSAASPSGSVLTSPSTTYSTAHANASFSLVSGTPPSDRSKTLYEAAEAGDVEEVKKLLREGANVNYRERGSRMSPLHEAASKGHTEVVAALIEFGARLNVVNEDGDTPLHLAASWGRRFCVEKLIQAGARIDIRDSDGDTALHLAAATGTYGCVRALLNAGADPDVQNELGEVPIDLAHNDSIRNLF